MNTQHIHACRLAILIPLVLTACGGGGGGSAGSTSTPTPTISYHLLSAGGASNCRIDGSTGSVKCWGQNGVGQLGIGNIVDPTATPASVNLGVKTAKQIAMGVEHGCAILNDDTVSCWGSNSAGQLGQALSTAISSTPVVVPSVTAKVITAGLEHTCIITLNNTVQCWGSNSKGQLGQTPGSLTQTHLPQTIAGLTAKSLKSGYNHLCAIDSVNTVKCWGDNQYGQLGNSTTTDSTTIVSAGNLASVQQLTTGAYHSCAATTAAISCWGRNDSGQLGSNGTTALSVPTQTFTVRASVNQLVAGLAHTCALSGTTAECWGSNANMQLSGSTGGGTSFVTVPLTNSAASPMTLKRLSAGLNHTCAVDDTNQTYCWGAGTSGRLGPSVSTDTSIPVLVP